MVPTNYQRPIAMGTIPGVRRDALELSLGSDGASGRAPAPPSFRNVFACLVHENTECVVDLVRNLRHLDPTSAVLLYNGSRDPHWLDSAPTFDRAGAALHPAPRPMQWGRLHDFAIDCMRYALAHLPFDAITIVDSDQLAMRPGYSERLAAFLAEEPGVGLLSNSPERQGPATRVQPARVAHGEIDLWRPVAPPLPRRRIEIRPLGILAVDGLHGRRGAGSGPALRRGCAAPRDPPRHQGVGHGGGGPADLGGALGLSRRRQPVQLRLREVPHAVLGVADRRGAGPAGRLLGPPDPAPIRGPSPPAHPRPVPRLRPGRDGQDEPAEPPPFLLTLPILVRMRAIEGWLDDEEADLLIGATAHALRALPGAGAVVEVGSYCGRSTVVLASVVKAVRPAARVRSIDTHDGKLGTADRYIRVAPSLEKLRANVQAAGLADVVEIIQGEAPQVPWSEAVALLLIDGLHDYASVSRDFYHFEPWLAEGGYVVFHDYAGYFPGVVAFVDTLVAGGSYRRVALAGSLIVLRRVAPLSPEAGTAGERLSR